MSVGRRPARQTGFAALLLALCLVLGQMLLLAHAHEDGQFHDQADCQLCLHQAGSKAAGVPGASPTTRPGPVDRSTPLPFTAAPAAPRYGAQARAPPPSLQA